MPDLYILGGANGVGKTTWYYSAVEQGVIDKELPFINVDILTLQHFGAYSVENIANAEQLARVKMTELISEGKSFLIESNLAKMSDYDWISAMRNKGYDTHLFFLGTNDVETNIKRVAQRVKEGGHNVAEAIIVHRYNIALTYLKSKLLDFTEAKLIDVSSEISKEMVSLEKQKILYKHPEIESWAKDSISIIERLQSRLVEKKELKDRNKGLGR